MNSYQKKKHSLYLDIAKCISKHAKCLRGNFGSVIVKDDIIIGTGLNGPARKIPHCGTCRRADHDSGFGYSLCPAIHSEANSLINAGGRRACIGATLYLDSHNRTPDIQYHSSDTLFSCDNCARLMVNAGIEWLIFRMAGEPIVRHIPTLVKLKIIQ